MLDIKDSASNFEREPLIAAFGFKGGYLDELWQIAAGLFDTSGKRSVGLGVQSTLWSDSGIFSSWSQSAGNSIMYLMSEYALKLLKGRTYENPVNMITDILPDVYEYGKKISNNNEMRMTFALNSLVCVDNAAWILHAANEGFITFDDMIPENLREPLSIRHDKLLAIPLINYGTDEDQIKKLLLNGNVFLKIKIGADPDKDGDPDKMLAWDKKRLDTVHRIAIDMETAHTISGRIPYYLDANGRYKDKDQIKRLLDHADRIDALENIVILEEPFPEDCLEDVSDLPVKIAADESAHSVLDVTERIGLGYKAIALKPIAKTLSLSLLMLNEAYRHNIPCFCADLTVNPVLVDWNKNVAARISPLPGLKLGVIESNGHQNYLNWDKMKKYNPHNEKSYTRQEKGVYTLGDSFYDDAAGIFAESPHYASLINF